MRVRSGTDKEIARWIAEDSDTAPNYRGGQGSV
jgi:hypothetical protein